MIQPEIGYTTFLEGIFLLSFPPLSTNIANIIEIADKDTMRFVSLLSQHVLDG